MYATIRRYEGVDATRTNEVSGKVNETLVPRLRELPGFAGYYLIEDGNGVLSSLGLFETSEQADESTKVVAKWITDENFDDGDPQRAEDHERQGRRSQRRRLRRRITRRALGVDEGARHVPGPLVRPEVAARKTCPAKSAFRHDLSSCGLTDGPARVAARKNVQLAGRPLERFPVASGRRSWVSGASPRAGGEERLPTATGGSPLHRRGRPRIAEVCLRTALAGITVGTEPTTS